MTFTSLLFALFVGITIIIYYLPPLKHHQWIVLLIASYYFYAYNSYKYMVFILFTTVTIYLAGRALDKTVRDASAKVKEMKGVWDKDEKKAFKRKTEGKKKMLLAAALLLNFGILFALKYLNFLAGGIMHLISGTSSTSIFNSYFFV